jgi:uncharacterized protein
MADPTTPESAESLVSGAPCWVDLMTSDAGRSTDFYTRLFGWSAEAPAAEFGGYVNFQRDGVRIAGCMASEPGSGMTDLWSVYLASDDARKTTDLAAAGGGQVLVQPIDVGDLGTMAVVADPGGAGIGIWQPGSHRGFGASGEAGTPSWFELQTRDYQAAVQFYRDVFGWDAVAVSDTDDFRYTVLRSGEKWLAGIMDASGFLAGEVPAHWSVYFGAADTDAALVQVVELGGSVLRPAEDTPYGRLATAEDPTGAQFKLVAPNEEMPAAPPSA